MSQQRPDRPPEGWQPPPQQPTQPLPPTGWGQPPPQQGQPPGQQARPGWGPPPIPPRSSEPRTRWYHRWWWAIAIGAFILGGVTGVGGVESTPRVETRTVTSEKRVATFTEFCFNYISEDDQQRCEEKEQEIRDAAKVAAAATATTATTKPKPKPAPAPETTFGDGLYEVGNEIPSGTYKTSGGQDCYYARLSSDNTNDIIANNITSGPQTVRVRSSDAFVEFSGGCTWRRSG
jgi:hypothetical protein